MTLIGNKVLVQWPDFKMWHGIHIPENTITHKDNPFMDQRIGTVVAIGTGRRTKKGNLIPITHIKVGDKVLLPRSDKVYLRYQDKNCWIVRAEEVLGALVSQNVSE